MAVTRKTKPKKPPPPKRPRLAKKLPKLSDPEALLTLGNTCVAAVANNATMFPNPPYTTPLRAALAALAPAITAAASGGVAAATALQTAALAVRDLLDQHGNWVDALATAAPPEQAAVIITTAGFHVSLVGATAKAKKQGVDNTTKSGTVLCQLIKVAGALMYFWETSTDQKTWTKEALDTELIKGTIAGLTPGQVYYFRFRSYIRGKGYTSPSQTFSLIVT
jgi:hypothetical protein